MLGCACYRRFANIWTFLAIFCLCFFLETITFTYLISAIQSIERQFEIPSSKSGTLVSAGDIGYVLFVVILSYFGSRGNRARWIGGGCLLISLACMLIALPHFIFKDKPALALKGSLVKGVLTPPPHLLYDNVTLEQLLAYPPIAMRVPEEAKKMLISLFPSDPNKEPKGDSAYSDYYANYGDYEETAVNLTSTPIPDFFDIDGMDEEVREEPGGNGSVRVKRFGPPKMSEAERQAMEAEKQAMQKLFWDVVGEKEPLSTLIKLVQEKISRPPPAARIMGIQRAASLPFGHCNPIVNGLKTKLEELKCAEKSTNRAAYGMVFLGILLIGIGHSMPWALGVPLIDDNVKKRSTPFYFAFVFFIRILGPVLGFMIGGAANKLYYNFDPPLGLTNRDPRWIGAWWLGFVIVFAALLIPSILLFLFPDSDNSLQSQGPMDEVEDYQLKGSKNRATGEKPRNQLHLSDKHRETTGEKPSMGSEMKLFLVALLAVLKSPVYTGALIGRFFDAFAFKGYFVFLPKYLESHYGMPQFKANFMLGIMGVVGFALGVALGSVVMRKLKLEGRKAAAYVGLISLVSSALAFVNLGLGCTSVVNMVGQQGIQVQNNFTTTCNAGCGCDAVDLFPVCSKNGSVYYSPCHAGCKNMTIIDKKTFQIEFRDCSCLDEGTVAKRDWCNDDCYTNMIIYFSIMIFSGLIGGTSVIPSILIVLRSVPPEHRSVALGFSGFIISLLSTFPSPIVYGILVDSACLVWNTVCGVEGSCKIYEPTQLRTRMYLFNGTLRALALLMDVWVWYWAKGLKLMEEEPSRGTSLNREPGDGSHLPLPIEKERKLSEMEALSSENIATSEMKI